jgi:hypothetical protein
MSDQVVTKKGSVLPLLNLKGKKYLMVAYRIQWMNEEVENFSISTEFLLLTEDQTIAKATIQIMDKDGKILKTSMATKRETKKDFPDHTEKAETSAIGRAISLLGFGTQFAISDLDEGMRLADSPLESVKKGEMIIPGKPTLEEAKAHVEKNGVSIVTEASLEPKKASSFRKPKPPVTPQEESEWT